MTLSFIPSPDLSRLAGGSTTLLLLEGLSFSADGSRLLVKASFLDSADGAESSSRIHYGVWLYDLNSQQYLGSLNALLGLGLGGTRDIEVTDAKIVGDLNSSQIVAKYYIKNSNDTPALAYLRDGVVLDFDVLATTAGAGAEVPITRYAVSQDGRFLAVQTSSAVLAALDVPDENEVDDIYLIDLTSKTTTRVSMAGNAGGNLPTFLGNIFSDGNSLFVSFITSNSFATQDANSNLLSEASSDAYLWRSGFTLDGLSGKPDLKVVSQTAGRATGYVDSAYGETIQTARGTFFNSSSAAYYANDSNGSTDPFLMGADGVTGLVEVTNQKSLSTGATIMAASLDGTVVALLTHAPEIVGTTGADKLLVVNLVSGATAIVSEPSIQAADNSVISAVTSIDGKQFAFTSLATNLTQNEPPASQGSLYVVTDIAKTEPDTLAPTVKAFSPADQATGVAIGADIVLTFSEAVKRGTGNIVLKTSGGSIIATYDAASSENLNIFGSTLTINPLADLGYNTGYKIEFASGSIKDIAGNSYAGVNDYIFTTDQHRNALPTGSVTISGTFTQGQTLSAANSLADLDGLGTINYQWSAGGVLIQGATASTYVLTQGDLGKAITVAASYTDGQGTLESVTSAALVDPLGKSVDLQAYSWKAHTLLDGVAVGIGSASQSTGSLGSTSFTGVTDTAITLSATRAIPTAEAVATSAAVSLQDAIAILKMIVGLDVNGTGKALSPYQALAADYDGNGLVQLSDAIGVLKHVVGLSAPDPTWHFVNELDSTVPAKANLAPGVAQTNIAANLSGSSPVHVGLVGYLSGDVDGSFAGATGATALNTSYFTSLVAAHTELGSSFNLAQFGIYTTP